RWWRASPRSSASRRGASRSRRPPPRGSASRAAPRASRARRPRPCCWRTDAMLRLTPLPPGLSFGHPAGWLSTWVGAGRPAIAPGTWGSAAALPFAYVILVLGGSAAGPYLLGAAALLAFGVGIWSSGVYCRHAGVGDPGAIVIDEV